MSKIEWLLPTDSGSVSRTEMLLPSDWECCFDSETATASPSTMEIGFQWMRSTRCQYYLENEKSTQIRTVRG